MDIRILRFTFVTNVFKTHVLLVRVLLRLSQRIGDESEERATKRWIELGATY